jgi:hypothetical protein
VRQLGLARILVEQRQPQAPALDTALAALPADPGRRHLRQPAKEWVRRRTDALRLALGTTLKMAIAATRRRRVAALVAALVAAGLVLNSPCVLFVPGQP